MWRCSRGEEDSVHDATLRTRAQHGIGDAEG
jgi:hypothetical protein